MTTSIEEQIATLITAAGQSGADVVGIAAQIARLAGQLPAGETAVQGQQAAVDVLNRFDPLVTSDPDHRKAVAEQLGTLTARLLEAGDTAQAQVVGHQAINAFRESAALGETNVESLASNLTIMDKFMSDVGDPVGALEAQQAAVDVLRTPLPTDPDAIRQELLADALATLANRFLDVKRPKDAAMQADDSIDTYAAVQGTLRTGMNVSASNLVDLAKALTIDGLPDVAELAQQAAIVAASGDATAPLPTITAEGSGHIMLAAAEVTRIGVLQTRIQAVNGELNILAGQMANAGLDPQAQHATSIIHPQDRPPPSMSYCANAGLALPGSRPTLSFPSLRGQWPRGTSLRVNIRTTGVKGQAAGPGAAAAAITNAFDTWQQAAHDVALDFFTFQKPTVDVLDDADIFVLFAAESDIPGIGPFKAAGYAPGEEFAGRIFLNSANPWTAAELQQVTLHEIGHILGFSDSHTTLSQLVVPDPKAPLVGLSTMHPASTNLVLDSETLSALRAAYGWSAQTRLPDRRTESRPSLGAGLETTMVWKELGGGEIWVSNFSGFHPDTGPWTPQFALPMLGITTHRPALAPVTQPRSGMMMAYRGTGGTILEVRNFFGRWDTEKAKPVGGAFSSDGPALATFGGKPHLVWKGLNDSGLHEQVMTDQDSRTWTAPTPVLAGPNGGPVGTIDTPALVEFRGRLFLFWKGLEGDNTIYMSSRGPNPGDRWTPQTRVLTSSYGGTAIPVGSTFGPSVTVRQDAMITELTGASTEVILLSWKGAKGDSDIWMNEFDGMSTSGQINVPARATATGPAVVQALESTFMAWKGLGDDDTIWWSRL